MAQPKHPHYSAEAVRLSSYSKWPMTSPQNPSVLCDAGFFYAGFSDCVRCFSCGGGLRNWEDGDVPWIEHARWYSDCDFLRQRKGDLFIQMHQQDRNQPVQLPPNPAEGHDQMEHKHSEPTNLSNKEDIAVMSVQEMGYSKSVIDSATDKLRKKGKRNYIAMDIMQIILEKEDNGMNATGDRHDTLHNFKTCASAPFTSTDSMSILEENKTLKDQMTCKICLDKDACMVYLPCGHMVTCQQCAPTVRKCCICRQLIQGTVRAYL